ncbi:ABC transporter permease [[Phormidium] sp. ETS-05]|uniref:PhnE/PtxC family ABC transporter permease n=1 Tax=[Phormidium] sp. ETS-05 TaxID=222819 RepID=UPI0018EEDB1F|nr:ABC transporter permease subunit [[Phormidium] sp. ETS-05]
MPSKLRILPKICLTSSRLIWVISFVAALIWSGWQAGILQKDLVNYGGASLFFQFVQASWQPDFSPEFLRLTIDATLKTLGFAVTGTFFSLIIGIIGGIFASQVWWEVSLGNQGKKWGRLSPFLLVRASLAIPRAIHEMIWGLFFVNIFGLDPLVGIVAIAIPFGAITAKVFAELLDTCDRLPLCAIINAGASPLSAFLYTIIPQTFPNLLSYAFYRFECSIRAAAVLGIIGAGGLGYEIFLSLQSHRYQQMWTLFWALVLLNGIVDIWSASLRHRFGAPSRLDLNFQKLSPAKPTTLTKTPSIPSQDPFIKLSLIAVAVILPLSFWYIQADFSKLWAPRTGQLLANFISSVWPPAPPEWGQLFTLSAQTIAMSILAMTGAGFGGILLSFFAANYSLTHTKSRPSQAIKTIIVLITRTLLLITRAIPAPVWALILLYVLFPGILPGSIALGIYNLGILGRLMAEVIENTDKRPLQALFTLGANQPQVFLYGILPHTLPRFLAYILYRWEVCTRETALVGLVGAGGLGRQLSEQLSSFDYPGLMVTLLAFIVVTFIVDFISTQAGKFLR